ncbi:MAG: hypothetical protein H6977_10375 [Gammaproteobacteria bacterium]|nr:hypothetical protein [Gammaproteobacteria bacterium]
MKQKMRALTNKLVINTYDHDQKVLLRTTSRTGTEGERRAVEIPVPIVFRLYHLGRAYDLQEVAKLHPLKGTKLGIDYLAVQLLIQELDEVVDLVNDPVVQHYARALAEHLKVFRTDTQAGLFMSVPS